MESLRNHLLSTVELIISNEENGLIVYDISAFVGYLQPKPSL